MILNMSGGGGAALNFKVVGNPMPGSPSENTIWLNTDEKITGWVLSPSEPENPVEGMVWIRVGDSGDVAFNALKKNRIRIYPLSTKQYLGGVWTKTESYISQNGSWTELVGSLVLFDGDDGGDNTDVTGGWSIISQTTQAELEIKSDHVYFLSASAGTVRRAGPVNSVDLSQYKTLYCDGVNKSTSDSDNYSFMLLGERTNSAEPVAAVRQPFGTRKVVSIDLTSITPRNNLWFAMSNASGSAGTELYRCWAE